ncbi:MAG: hypothetical protein NTV86_16975 [Planctomycetota bacterium]|nr:hypothetical protein [Planctomycetota bacterium]
MSEAFQIGPVAVEVSGRSRTADVVRRVLAAAPPANGPVQLRFEFRDALEGPPIEGSCQTRPGGFAARDRLFDYQVSWSAPPASPAVTVAVAPRSKPLPSRLADRAREAWKYWRKFAASGRLHFPRRFLFYVYMPMLELTLLERRSTLVHCSAIEKNGRAILFPAVGGVGKTSIMCRYVADGWRYLADDMCVLAPDGAVAVHPLPMHVYGYHKHGNPELVAKVRSTATAMDRLLWTFWCAAAGEDQVVRWVPAERVFGRDRMADTGQVAKVVFLRRCEADAFSLHEAGPEELSRAIVESTLAELNDLPRICRGLAGAAPGVPLEDQLAGRMHQACLAGLSRSAGYIVDVPAPAGPNELRRFLDERGVVA